MTTTTPESSFLRRSSNSAALANRKNHLHEERLKECSSLKRSYERLLASSNTSWSKLCESKELLPFFEKIKGLLRCGGKAIIIEGFMPDNTSGVKKEGGSLISRHNLYWHMLNNGFYGFHRYRTLKRTLENVGPQV
jgi:hypothetical protein